jgi:hypothetical protein
VYRWPDCQRSPDPAPAPPARRQHHQAGQDQHTPLRQGRDRLDRVLHSESQAGYEGRSAAGRLDSYGILTRWSRRGTPDDARDLIKCQARR